MSALERDDLMGDDSGPVVPSPVTGLTTVPTGCVQHVQIGQRAGQCPAGPKLEIPPEFVRVCGPRRRSTSPIPSYKLDGAGNIYLSWTEVSVDAYASDASVNLVGNLDQGDVKGVSAELPPRGDGRSGQGWRERPVQPATQSWVDRRRHLRGVADHPAHRWHVPTGVDTHVSYQQGVEFNAGGVPVTAEVTLTEHNVFLPTLKVDPAALVPPVLVVVGSAGDIARQLGDKASQFCGSNPEICEAPMGG